jgi:threonine/homoserine/homoserine lactone efflux protein
MAITGFTDFGHLWLFAILVFGIIVVPGMDMAFVRARALIGGARGGWLAVVGLAAGGMVHTLIARLGVGLVLQAAPGVFPAMLILGSAYVAGIGWLLWRHAGALGLVEAGDAMPAAAIIRQAMLTCLLNPKAYLFMIAVFPQFFRPGQGPLLNQSVTLGFMIACAQFVIYGAVAAGAAGLRSRIAGNPAAQVTLGRAIGLLLMLTAAWALWQGWRTI